MIPTFLRIGEVAQRRTEIDPEAVTELVLYITNDGDLYRQRAKPMIDNLARKILRGTYDHEKAVRLWRHLADAGAQKYTKEFDVPSPEYGSYGIFSPATRDGVAEDLRDHYDEEVRGRAEQLRRR